MLLGDIQLEPLETPVFKTVGEEIDWLRARVDSQRLELTEAQIRIRFLNSQLYGPSSERTRDPDVEGQETLFGVPVHCETESPEETSANAEPQDKQKKKKNRNGGGRQPISENLETVEIVVPAEEHQKHGPDGKPFVLLGYETSKRVHIEPARLLCMLIMREKWGPADTHCVEEVAAVPPAIIPKGKLTDGAIIELMYNKYIMGLPFYRQVANYNLVENLLNTSLCSDAAKAFAAFVTPICSAILAEILTEPFIHLDETIMRELALGRCHRRYIWVWHAGGQSYFHYGGRGTKEVLRVLAKNLPDDTAAMTEEELNELVSGKYHGFFMADGLSVYDKVCRESAGLIQRLLCMVHARRQFRHLENSFGHAREIVGLFNAVMKVDREALKYCKKHKLTGAEHQQHLYQQRQAQALPALEALRKRMTELRPHYAAIKDMTNAFNYSLDNWDDLCRYTTRGDLPIDNNAAERAVRPVVIGRKNYLFVGSEDAGDWCATNYTLFESARALRLDPRRYINWLIAEMHSGRTDYQAMTPKAYKQALAQQG